MADCDRAVGSAGALTTAPSVAATTCNELNDVALRLDAFAGLEDFFFKSLLQEVDKSTHA